MPRVQKHPFPGAPLWLPAAKLLAVFWGVGGGEPDLAQGKRNSLQVYVSRTAYPTCQALRIELGGEERAWEGRT